MGNATSASYYTYMVCGRSIIDYDFILRLYVCVYHSLESESPCIRGDNSNSKTRTTYSELDKQNLVRTLV